MGTILSRRLASIFIVAVLPACLSAQVIYVKTTGNDSHTGASWSQAYRTIQKALSAAVSGDEIWVALGTYFPDEGPTQTDNDETESFFLKSGVSIYGGFAGDETMRSERDPETFLTILSGDIQQDDIHTNNAHHIVVARGSQSDAARLNGFTLAWGDASGAFPRSIGGAIHMSNSAAVTINRCIFRENQAAISGGAISIDSASTPTFNACIFVENIGSSSGGAAFIDNGSQPIFNACIFKGNSFSGGSPSGGAVLIEASTPSFQSCQFTGNAGANTGGAAFCRDAGSVMFTGCTFSGNHADAGGGAVYNDNSNVTFINTIFWNNEGSGSTSLPSSTIFTFGGTSTFSHCLIPLSSIPGLDLGDNVFGNPNVTDIDPLFVDGIDPMSSPQSGGDFRLQSCSPAIDAGDSTASNIEQDAARQDRVFGANIDIGAYEVQTFTRTWTGTGDGTSWVDADNWSEGIVPGLCDDVVIPDGSTVDLSSLEQGFGGTLEVSSNVELEISQSAELSIEQQ